jgi:hypothetical protein
MTVVILKTQESDVVAALEEPSDYKAEPTA